MPYNPLYSLQINGVTCTIACREDGSEGVIENVSPQGPEATVLYKCPYLQRYQLIKGLIGSAVYSGGKVVRTLPTAYLPSSNLYCMEIGEIRGMAPVRDLSTNWLIYRDAIVPAIYRVPPYSFQDLANSAYYPADSQVDPSGKGWTTTTVSMEGEVFTPPNGSYQWVGGKFDGKPVPNGAVGLIESKFAFEFRRHMLPLLPLKAVRQYRGSVNSVAITIGDDTFPVGTLLFVGFEAEPSFDPLGNMIQEVVYKVLGADRDWNYFLDPGGNWRQIIQQGTGGTPVYPFPYMDFWNNLP